MTATQELSCLSPAPAAVVDRFGRRFRYLRVSVTDLCNMSCTYCNPVQGCAVTHPHRLSWDDLDFLVDVAVNDLGVEAVRITGGEPLVRPGITGWIHGLRRHEGLRDVSMTTNGILLARMARELRAAGLDRVNVSLDTFDAGRYAEVTRGGSLERCLEGIQVALKTFRRVKINAVALKGVVLDEIEKFIRFSDEHGVEVRFIELMPIFDEKEFFHSHFISVEALREHIARLGYQLEPDGSGPAEGNRTGYGPATTFRVAGTGARVGFISQMSSTKCLFCNKLRLTSDGALKPCLLMPEEIDLAPAIAMRNRGEIAHQMKRQFLERAERYDVAVATEQSLRRPMQATGG